MYFDIPTADKNPPYLPEPWLEESDFPSEAMFLLTERQRYWRLLLAFTCGCVSEAAKIACVRRSSVYRMLELIGIRISRRKKPYGVSPATMQWAKLFGRSGACTVVKPIELEFEEA